MALQKSTTMVTDEADDGSVTPLLGSADSSPTNAKQQQDFAEISKAVLLAEAANRVAKQAQEAAALLEHLEQLRSQNQAMLESSGHELDPSILAEYVPIKDFSTSSPVERAEAARRVTRYRKRRRRMKRIKQVCLVLLLTAALYYYLYYGSAYDQVSMEEAKVPELIISEQDSTSKKEQEPKKWGRRVKKEL